MENLRNNSNEDYARLCRLMYAVMQMRHFQREFFAYRREQDKRQAIQWEKQVDNILNLLRMHGYKPLGDYDAQTKLF